MQTEIEISEHGMFQDSKKGRGGPQNESGGHETSIHLTVNINKSKRKARKRQNCNFLYQSSTRYSILVMHTKNELSPLCYCVIKIPSDKKIVLVKATASHPND